ncbi:hypothetical protein ACIBF5_27365 [Micromonospora sp. NPDC050417]|uniref:hypothetical protein n=1 Tax=Micromonospora sp. NPDC050417 TaxID=3364280 RepID=UPI0037B4869D
MTVVRDRPPWALNEISLSDAMKCGASARSTVACGVAVTPGGSLTASYPDPVPAVVSVPRVNAIVLAPAATIDGGNDSVASRRKPLRSAWRAILRWLLIGSEPLRPAADRDAALAPSRSNRHVV